MDPVPTTGGALLMTDDFRPGPLDQTAVEAREDVLVFTTEPLAEDLEVTGRVRAVLFVATDGPSTDWVARLCDVNENGVSRNVAEGIVRVRAATPGEAAEHVVDLWSGWLPASETNTEASGGVEFHRPGQHTVSVERSGMLGRVAVEAAELARVRQRYGQVPRSTGEPPSGNAHLVEQHIHPGDAIEQVDPRCGHADLAPHRQHDATAVCDTEVRLGNVPRTASPSMRSRRRFSGRTWIRPLPVSHVRFVERLG
jgi:hypothetical protein